MLVFVINQHKKLLMPCKPSKARKLLQAGKAKVGPNILFHNQVTFRKQWLYSTCNCRDGYRLKVVGCAAIANGKVFGSVRNLPERKRFEKDGTTEDVPENQKRAKNKVQTLKI